MDAKEQLEARRKSDRERFKRWKEKQAQAGKRHITAMISGEAYNIICQERDRTGNTTAEVIEQALLQKKPEPDRTTDRDTINSQAERIFELEARLKKLEGKKAPPNDEPDTLTMEMFPGTPSETPDEIIKRMVMEYERQRKKPAWVKIALALNKAGLKTPSGKPWTNDNARIYHKRMKDKH